jgi:riboflavin synthase
MFTGIITDLGEVAKIEQRGDTLFTIKTSYDLKTIDIGASIACSGCCLTVIAKGEGAFDVEASAETLSKTTLGSWQAGTRINLERSLKLGDELGGHLVSGHVDGVGEIIGVEKEGGSLRFGFRVPMVLARFIAQKGSVALDGTSFTVNEVKDDAFAVNIIPHTQSITTWGHAKTGDRANVEIDMLARYVARLQEFPAT